MVKIISNQVQKEIAEKNDSQTLFNILMKLPVSDLKIKIMLINSKDNPHLNIIQKKIR